MRKKAIAVAHGVVLLLSTSGMAWAQCAMCKTLLTNSPEGRAMSGRFNAAIVLMLVAPYVIASGVLLAVFRARLRGRLETAGTALRQCLRVPARPPESPV
jgi:hypothetical protein